MMSIGPRNILPVGVVAGAAAGAVLVAFLLGSSLRPVAPTPRPDSSPQTIQPVTLAASTTADTITVVGAGTASAAPDEATVVIGVAATRPNVHDAVATANADMSRLLSALHNQGAQDKDIQTFTISINQQTTCCPSTMLGYSATNQVTVTIHHLANVSGVLLAAVDAVGNDIQLSGVSVLVANPTAAITAARAGAMADASARAQAWAKLAGHHVGGLISLSEIVTAAPYSPCYGGCGGAGAGGGVPVMAGQTSFAVTVTATYELLG